MKRNKHKLHPRVSKEGMSAEDIGAALRLARKWSVSKLVIRAKGQIVAHGGTK